MLKRLALTLSLAACTPIGGLDIQPQDRIIIAERGRIEGGYSLIVTPDDRVVYDAYGTDIAPQTTGWNWQDPSHQTGQASIYAPGAFARAATIVNRAANQSALPPTTCTTAGQGSIVAVRGPETLFQRIANTCLNSSPAGSPQAQYIAAFNALRSDLRAAILPANWLSR